MPVNFQAQHQLIETFMGNFLRLSTEEQTRLQACQTAPSAPQLTDQQPRRTNRSIFSTHGAASALRYCRRTDQADPTQSTEGLPTPQESEAFLSCKATIENRSNQEWIRAFHQFRMNPTRANKDALKHLLLTQLNPYPNQYSTRDSSLLSTVVIPFITGALSHAYVQSKQELDRIADAHTFYQFFGLAGEHYGWQLDALDMYNYFRNKENISTLKETIYALITPQHALLHEYVQIARYEKNRFHLMVRVLVPLVITALVLVSTFSFMAPLVISELFEFLMFFPTLYFAMAIASLYIELKNQAYTNAIAWWWGDVYSAPAFQINERLTAAFLSRELAQAVSNCYTASLKDCDHIEQQYAMKPTGTLSEHDLEARQVNRIRKSELLLEWYDVHENAHLGYDKAPGIVIKRLQTEQTAMIQRTQQTVALYVDALLDEVQPQPIDEQRIQVAQRGTFFNPRAKTHQLSRECEQNINRLTEIDSASSQITQITMPMPV